MAVSTSARSMPWTRTPAAVSIRLAMAAEQERIGQFVRDRREALGIDQAELAHQAGVDTKTIYRVENALIDSMRKSTREAIAKALKVKPDELLPSVPAPDLMGTMNGDRSQLDRIEELLTEIRDLLRSTPGGEAVLPRVPTPPPPASPSEPQAKDGERNRPAARRSRSGKRPRSA